MKPSSNQRIALAAHLKATAAPRIMSCALGLAILAQGSAHAGNYNVTDLGSLPGQTNTWTWQQTINSRGEVAAYANTIPDPNAFSGDESYVWSGGTVYSLPGLAGATDTIAFALNDVGQVVGRSTQPGAPNHPVLWDHGTIQVLPELPGDNKGGALMINNYGNAVGYSANTALGIRRAVVWSGGSVSPLPPLAGGGIYDEALGINQHGDIAGFSGSGSGSEHIAVWRHGTATDLGTLGGTWGDGYAINDRGQVVGLSATASGAPDAFLWDGGNLLDLGTLAGDSFSEANGINDESTVVGFSGGDPNDITTWHAVLWRSGQMIDLQSGVSPDSGWTLLAASGINNRGQIDGFGIHNGQFRSFLLTPNGD